MAFTLTILGQHGMNGQPMRVLSGARHKSAPSATGTRRGLSEPRVSKRWLNQFPNSTLTGLMFQISLLYSRMARSEEK